MLNLESSIKSFIESKYIFYEKLDAECISYFVKMWTENGLFVLNFVYNFNSETSGRLAEQYTLNDLLIELHLIFCINKIKIVSTGKLASYTRIVKISEPGFSEWEPLFY